MTRGVENIWISFGKYFQIKFKSFQNPFHLNKWKKSCHLLSRVLYLKSIWIHGDHKCKNESLGKSYYSLSFNFFKKFRISLNQSHNNQTINQIYLFIITYQNLEFWDATLFFFICTQCHNFDPNVQSYLRVIGVVLEDWL